MKIRTSLNSQVLKSRFPEVYRDFFSKCQLVVSAPHFFTWAGEYIGYWGGMMILQKIPLRIYIGLDLTSNSKNQGRITIENDAKSYSIKEDKFRLDQYDHLSQQTLLKFINDNCTSFLKKGRDFKIHILSELPLGATGSASAMSSALAVLLTLQNGNVGLRDIQKWKALSSKDLIEKKSLKFNYIFRLAWKLITAYQKTSTSGGPLFNILLPSALPVFYCLVERQNFKLPLEIGDNYQILERTPFLGGRVEEVFNFEEFASWPIDFALVSVGEPRETCPFFIQELQDTFIKVNKFINKDLKEFFSSERQPRPFFYHKSKVWQATLQVMDALSTRVLMEFRELLKAEVREDVLRDFLRTIDKNQILFLLLGVNSPQLDLVNSILHQEAFQIDSLGAGIKSVSRTQRGVMLFVMPHGHTSSVMDKSILRVKKELKLDLQTIYASWLDGIEEDGVLVEQYLDERIYSDFISKNAIQVHDFSQKTPLRLFLSPEEFAQRKKQIDLLLVEEEDKIYIKGKPLTSKELHSRKATIKLLKILLEKRGQEVSNQELPRSSYSHDRYELQGKIVIPLIKAIEKRIKKKLDLEVRGGITDFYLRLDPGAIKIWIVY